MYIRSGSSSFLNFFTFSTRDQKDLANLSALEDIQFFLKINEIVDRQNLNSIKLNLFDKFLILLQIRMFYVGTGLNFNVLCSNCNSTISVNKDLNIGLQDFEIFEKNYKKIESLDLFELNLNIPSGENLNQFIISEWHDYKYLLLDSLKIKNIDIDYSSLSLEDKKHILNNLPKNINNIVDQYFTNLLDVKISNFISFKCPTCNHSDQFDLNFINLLTFLKKILFNFNYEEILLEIAGLSKKLNLSPEFILNCSPLERNNYVLLVEKTEQHSETENRNVQPNTEFGF